MTPEQIRQTLDDMKSGECRLIGTATVYCHSPLIETLCPMTGRKKWQRGPRWYRTHCPGVFDYSAAELHADPAPWFDEETTVSQVLVAIAAPPAGPEWKSRWSWAEHLALYPVAATTA
jgi:hypothetical protein